jgi:rsbT co-antagonist protein RsbR
MAGFALEFILTFVFVICNVALATFVAVRAWDHRPARIFVILVALLVGIGITIFGQATFYVPDEVYLLRSIQQIQTGLLSMAFAALLSAIFVPVWWEGRRPIIWILLPYLIINIIVSIDLLARLGVFVDGLTITEAKVSFNISSLGVGLLILFGLSWLLSLAIMITSFVRDRQARQPILALGGSIVLSMLINSSRDWLILSPVLRGLLILVPIPIALAFAVFRTRLITPLPVAIAHAFEAMSDAAVVLNTSQQISYANAQAIGLGLQPNQDFRETLHALNANLDLTITSRAGGPPQYLELYGRRLAVSSNVLADHLGQQIGTLVLGRDVTELEERTIQLEEERTRLATVVQALESERKERAALEATVQAITLPLIPIFEGVLVLPLVGVFDTMRMDNLRVRLLEAIERQRTRLVMLDLTGLSFLDAAGAVGLSSSIQAARLLGARCVLVGVRPEIAEAIVAQGLPIDNVPTASTLQQAVKQALPQFSRTLTA